MSVIAPAINPPVQLSAVAIIAPLARALSTSSAARAAMSGRHDDAVVEPGRDDGGKPGQKACPEIVEHHAVGVAAPVGPPDGPRLPDVEEPEEDKGRDRRRPGQKALEVAKPKAGGGEKEGKPLARDLIYDDLRRILARSALKHLPAGPEAQKRDKDGGDDKGRKAEKPVDDHRQDDRDQ